MTFTPEALKLLELADRRDDAFVAWDRDPSNTIALGEYQSFEEAFQQQWHRMYKQEEPHR